MDLVCEERLSDSPFVETVWRSESEHAGSFISMAEIHCGMVVTKHQGKIRITVRGPATSATSATPAYCPADAEWFGVQFKPGTMMLNLPPRTVMNRQDVDLPEAGSQSFWLNGSSWQFPTYENVDTFIDWLAHDGLLVHDPVVDAVLQGQPLAMSQRTIQRRFLQATGLTQGAVHQIERALYAASLLKEGMSILDTVHEAGYFDQPHLTRSLKQLIGQTPAQIMDTSRTERLSFLYKTSPLYNRYAVESEQIITRGA